MLRGRGHPIPVSHHVFLRPFGRLVLRPPYAHTGTMKAHRLQSVIQRMLFAAERYREHELANHAAAGAYGFLLSAAPAILLALSFTSTLVGANPRVVAEINRLVARFLGPLSSSITSGAYFGHRLSFLAAAIGLVSLAWAARLFAVTVQRGIRVVWAATAKKTLVQENAMSFLIELVTLIAMVALIAAGEGAHIAARAVRGVAGVGAARAIVDVERLVPAVALFLFTGWSYMAIPAKRPNPKAAWGSAALCFVFLLAVTEVFSLFISAARYELLYGVLGNLILLLVNVFAFFSLYFYFAELVYVADQFDALLFGRFHRLARTRRAGGGVSRLERALFMERPGSCIPMDALSERARCFSRRGIGREVPTSFTTEGSESTFRPPASRAPSRRWVRARSSARWRTSWGKTALRRLGPRRSQRFSSCRRQFSSSIWPPIQMQPATSSARCPNGSGPPMYAFRVKRRLPALTITPGKRKPYHSGVLRV